MKKGSITRFKLNPRKPPKTDWRAFDAMSDEERHQAALSDPDCSARNRSTACARAPRADGASVAQEAELDAGRVRGAIPPSARDGARLGAGGAPPRQGSPSAPHRHCKRPGCRGARSRRIACFRLPVRWRSFRRQPRGVACAGMVPRAVISATLRTMGQSAGSEPCRRRARCWPACGARSPDTA